MAIAGALAVLCACGSDYALNEATASHARFVASRPGSTPFIASATLQVDRLRNLTDYTFTIQPKSGALSAPVRVSYHVAALENRGYLQAEHRSDPPAPLTLPIFGLYAGHSNQVSIELRFNDGSSTTLPVTITTEQYVDPTGIYSRPVVLRQRTRDTQLGFNYFALKSLLGTPVIVDTDGELRWVGTGIGRGYFSSIDSGDGFVIGDRHGPTVRHLRLDDTLSQSPLQAPDVISFHHNIDAGKRGFLVAVNTAADLESIALEITGEGTVLNRWDLGAILGAHMAAHGDDPRAFVRPGVDWFHMNSAAYDPRDDSVIVSSRENFLVKLDYATGSIIWIFGDPTKYWYTFPSLRTKALTLHDGGLYPIGQHSVSLTSDGLLMVFNNGLGSFFQPAGAPAGQSRAFSTVSAYSIDAGAGMARQAWEFDYGRNVLSIVCSSVYETRQGSYLVDYAVADNFRAARLVGLDSNRNVAFDFQYLNAVMTCNTSWNAVPIYLETLRIAQ